MSEDKKFAFARQKHNELLEMINALETQFHTQNNQLGELNIKFAALEGTVKGIQQNLAEIMNLGPTITQKKMWVDELMATELELVRKLIESKIKEFLSDSDLNIDGVKLEWTEPIKQLAERLKKLR